MAFEELKASISLILDEIAKRPDDRHVLQEQLREKCAELEKMGLPAPEDLRRFEEELKQDSSEDPFDNLPV